MEFLNLAVVRRIMSLVAVVLLAEASSLTAQAGSGAASESNQVRATNQALTLAQPPALQTPGLPFDRMIRPGVLRELEKLQPARGKASTGTVSPAIPLAKRSGRLHDCACKYFSR
jgi:hypothetical protein